ncbi:MAG: recombinase RecX [Rhodothermaceae bacterium]|nr:recombinase RecX [Rhodothermaceae bacterium]|tara:strand:- start:18 stop:734 length:717 start_codon:yes stop_codon:yes gene_type:complete
MAFNSQRRERPDPADLDLADGTITRVAQQKKDLDRASIYIDDAFAFGLAVDLVIEAGLRKGVVLTAQQQRDLLVRQEVFAAKASALAGLSQRARTTDEVRQSLLRKGFTEAVVEDTVAAVERIGLVDDEAYAKAFVRDRFNGRGYGPARLRQDLMRKGVGRSVIDAALDELTEAEDLGEEARAQAAKKWRSLASEADPRKRQKKTLDFLVRRGFGFDTARAAVEAAAAGEAADEWGLS